MNINNASDIMSTQAMNRADRVKSLNNQVMDDHEMFKNQIKVDQFNEKLAVKHKSTLGQEDFLTLLMKELEYQDPLDPMDNKEFIGQMAQFSNLQQTTEIGTNLEKMIDLSGGGQAYSMLGKTVSYVNPSAPDVMNSGVVKSISFDANDQVSLAVNDEKISIYDVVQVNALTDDNN